MKAALALPLILAACMPQDVPVKPDHTPLTLPLADGRPAVVYREPRNYNVSRTQTSHGFEFRVTRLGRDFDYSEGLLARKVAETFCQGYNRAFSARAIAHFSQPNAWVFNGDCA